MPRVVARQRPEAIPAAIDGDRLGVDVGRFVAREEQDGVGDLLRASRIGASARLVKTSRSPSPALNAASLNGVSI
jgi:hypothetical protein